MPELNQLLYTFRTPCWKKVTPLLMYTEPTCSGWLPSWYCAPLPAKYQLDVLRAATVPFTVTLP